VDSAQYALFSRSGRDLAPPNTAEQSAELFNGPAIEVQDLRNRFHEFDYLE